MKTKFYIPRELYQKHLCYYPLERPHAPLSFSLDIKEDDLCIKPWFRFACSSKNLLQTRMALPRCIFDLVWEYAREPDLVNYQGEFTDHWRYWWTLPPCFADNCFPSWNNTSNWQRRWIPVSRPGSGISTISTIYF